METVKYLIFIESQWKVCDAESRATTELVWDIHICAVPRWEIIRQIFFFQVS